MKNTFNVKFSMLVILTFIAFTIIGTLTHEFGHLAVAKYFGYDTELSYGSISYLPKGQLKDENYIELQEIFEKYKDGDLDSISPKDKERGLLLEHYLNETYPEGIKRDHEVLIALGGPIQTILTSIFGLFILWYRNSKKRTEFGTIDWLAVFLGLFILRQIFNCFTAFYYLIIDGNVYMHSDEFRVSSMLMDNQWILPITLMIIAAIVVYYILFKIIPKRYQLAFIISGFIGGLLGYSIWFGFLGNILIG